MEVIAIYVAVGLFFIPSIIATMRVFAHSGAIEEQGSPASRPAADIGDDGVERWEQ